MPDQQFSDSYSQPVTAQKSSPNYTLIALVVVIVLIAGFVIYEFSKPYHTNVASRSLSSTLPPIMTYELATDQLEKSNNKLCSDIMTPEESCEKATSSKALCIESNTVVMAKAEIWCNKNKITIQNIRAKIQDYKSRGDNSSYYGLLKEIMVYSHDAQIELYGTLGVTIARLGLSGQGDSSVSTRENLKKSYDDIRYSFSVNSDDLSGMQDKYLSNVAVGLNISKSVFNQKASDELLTSLDYLYQRCSELATAYDNTISTNLFEGVYNGGGISYCNEYFKSIK